MQTFLPLPDFAQAAACLDNRRLGKQLVECVQVHTAILDPAYGWQSHPCVHMWRAYPAALVVYACACYREYQARWHAGRRSGKLYHKSGDQLQDLFIALSPRDYASPHWLGDERVHSSHRACLLAKNFPWYSQFAWSEFPTPQVDGRWPYYWPT